MSAARYYQRSPRYVFRPGDNSLLRFAGMDTKGQTTHARVRDLSATGLSFVFDEINGANRPDTLGAPFEGELLKVEFGVPGKKQIAWFAIVVRVETRSEWHPEKGDISFTLIALRFRELPQPFQQAIEQSVNGRVNEEEHVLDESADPSALAAFCGLSLTLLLSLYWLSLPLSTWLTLVR